MRAGGKNNGRVVDSGRFSGFLGCPQQDYPAKAWGSHLNGGHLFFREEELEKG